MIVPRQWSLYTCVMLLAVAAAGCANDDRMMAATPTATTRPLATPAAPSTRPATPAQDQQAESDLEPQPLHLHLPGIGGYRGVDRGLLRGLREGGYDASLKPYDWTGSDAGLAALVATKRHRAQSKRIAEILLKHARTNPAGPITVTAHSAGAGIIAWALEQLPPDVQVDRLVLIAPALSPQYDLSRALSHVREKAYVFYSPYDEAVLGLGTKMFGTVDGVKVEASGKVGFTPPPNVADKQQYDKLVQVPYRSEWIKLGNIGDHIGGLSRPFAKAVLAPLLARGELPGATPSAAADGSAATPPDPLSVPPPLPAAATAPATLPVPEEAGR